MHSHPFSSKFSADSALHHHNAVVQDAVAQEHGQAADPDHAQAMPIERPSVHAHVHSEESLRAIVNRLSRIEGHVRGVKTMVQESRPCAEVLVQIAAIRGALDRVGRLVLDEHLTQCIARAAEEGNIEVEIAELRAALDRFLS